MYNRSICMGVLINTGGCKKQLTESRIEIFNILAEMDKKYLFDNTA